MREYWSGLLFLPPGDLPDPGFGPTSPALAGRFFATEPLGGILNGVVLCCAVLSCFSRVQLFVTPGTVAHQGSSVHGIIQE